VLTRVVNPVTRALLASPLHRLLPGTAVLRYTGRRTGTSYALPVSVQRHGDHLVIRTRHRRQWWRNLRDETPVGVRLGGVERRGTATVLAFAPGASQVVVDVRLDPPPRADRARAVDWRPRARPRPRRAATHRRAAPRRRRRALRLTRTEGR